MYRYSLHIDLWALINDAHPPPHPAPFERPFRKVGEDSSEAIPDVRVGGPHPLFSDPHAHPLLRLFSSLRASRHLGCRICMFVT